VSVDCREPTNDFDFCVVIAQSMERPSASKKTLRSPSVAAAWIRRGKPIDTNSRFARLLSVQPQVKLLFMLVSRQFSLPTTHSTYYPRYIFDSSAYCQSTFNLAHAGCRGRRQMFFRSCRDSVRGFWTSNDERLFIASCISDYHHNRAMPIRALKIISRKLYILHHGRSV
jgi:hypothetical protein